ncbi:hypothetical protein LOTGIDRAFT_159702 [Lottia gigantea]|uniref:Uncharacterized protein n=1 Tax=Lottia gigantea TaxID=225164 RepID=V4AIU8_LOTGI|nr:hypothetical protein LOTGIDRAFT_159702 [Lottia gigantea]ESO96947.1 hypothetical protein LOTGIDRAFT_159702 [Lottia gigantea]
MTLRHNKPYSNVGILVFRKWQMDSFAENIKENMTYIITGVAGIAVGYSLYRAWRYVYYDNGDDEYFERLQPSTKSEKRKILIIGLDGSGKTRFSRCFCKGRRRLGSTEETTIGFYVNTVKLGEVSLDMWDVGGSPNCREYWKDFRGFTMNLDLICYCVDSSLPSRFNEARRELHKFLQYESTNGIPLILVATKQDLPNAVSPSQVLKQMSLNEFESTRSLYTVGVQAPNDGPRKGFMDTFRLFVTIVNQNRKQK